MNPLFTLALAQKTNCCQDKTVVDECVSTAEAKVGKLQIFQGHGQAARFSIKQGLRSRENCLGSC